MEMRKGMKPWKRLIGKMEKKEIAEVLYVCVRPVCAHLLAVPPAVMRHTNELVFAMPVTCLSWQRPEQADKSAAELRFIKT